MEAVYNCVKKRHRLIYERADENAKKTLNASSLEIKNILSQVGIPLDDMCFAIVGSVGRSESLEASDLDLIPIARNNSTLSAYKGHDTRVRKVLADKLNTKVSQGLDLTSATSVELLTCAESIGGSQDNSGALTKRILLLTESQQGGGDFSLNEIKKALLDAYGKQERTSGRHILTLCNDLARYYKTLCVEYKAKIEEENKDWCTRNIKLRHSRKLWHFSNIISLSIMADKFPTGEEDFQVKVLDLFSIPPVCRLAQALGDRQPLAVGRLLENYSYFLEFMSRKENREALSEVDHGERYVMKLDNPFLAMKFNSDLIHYEMMAIIEDLGPEIRSRIMSWFML